jgi:hypothetical protein
MMAKPYAKPDKNSPDDTGTNEKNTLRSLLLKAGLKKAKILYTITGKLIRKPQKRPISIERSANWNGDVVAITTSFN